MVTASVDLGTDRDSELLIPIREGRKKYERDEAYISLQVNKRGSKSSPPPAAGFVSRLLSRSRAA